MRCGSPADAEHAARADPQVMHETRIGGAMEATYTVTASSRPQIARRSTMKSVLRGIAAVLAESARGDEFNWQYATPASAQFAALPRSQQSRALDHGRRPASG